MAPLNKLSHMFGIATTEQFLIIPQIYDFSWYSTLGVCLPIEISKINKQTFYAALTLKEKWYKFRL